MLNKLLDIFKKSGESKIIVLDRQSEDFYVLTKWDDYEKLLGDRSGKTQIGLRQVGDTQTPADNQRESAYPKRQNQRVSASTDNISDEERFFLEPNG